MNSEAEALYHFSVWWESADGDRRTRDFLPEGLQAFVELQKEYNSSVCFSLIEIAFLFMEVLMCKLEVKREQFASIDEWLGLLSQQFQANQQRWEGELRSRLSSAKALKVVATVYRDGYEGRIRTSIPRSAAEAQAMAKNDAIRFTL